MRTDSLLKCYAYATVTSIALLGPGTGAKAQDLPLYMEPISGRTAEKGDEFAAPHTNSLRADFH
jgi:hypothetical protein